MTDKYKGVVEIDISGEKRGFKFGISAMSMLCELENCSLKEVVERLDDTSNLKTQVNFYYSAAISFVRLKNAEEKTTLQEPTFDQVANWIDCLAVDIKNQLNEIAFAQYVDPNKEAPQETGQ